MRSAILCILLIAGLHTQAQELENLRHSRNEDFKYDFYISFSEKKVKYQDTLHYYWFKSQKIHVTQGSSSGNLLDGPFTKFYYSGQLAEKGQFDKGLKTGEWKQWYENGNLASIYHYSGGILSGAYTLYNESGDVRESGKIRNGLKKQKRKREKRKRDKSDTEEIKDDNKPDKKAEREKRKQDRIKRRKEEGNFFQRLFKKKEKQSV